MTDLQWIIAGCVIAFWAAIEVARACRAARRRDDLKPDQWGV